MAAVKVGSLFSGIGGFELGLERAGMEVAWSCDVEPFAQHILKKHWPHAPVYGDITELRGADVEPVDVLCGGFPCQDISVAGKGAGIKEGTRSGLWSHYARLVGELRPSYVIVENVAALRRRGLDRVLGDLSLLGYDAEWDRIRASDVGAPHQRARLWLVAYPQRVEVRDEPRRVFGPRREGADVAGLDGGQRTLADAYSEGRAASWRDAISDTAADREGQVREPARSGVLGGGWPAEPDVGRVAHGVPARLDRLRGLGNALVPQIAQWIGERILAYEAGLRPGSVAGSPR